jgi:CRISPR-associated exonuclease Cas4
MTEFAPDEWLPLSGIQHFVFCRRQWALIHIEQQWQENVLTVEGHLMHRRADDPFFTEKRGGVIIARSVPVASPTLGLTGVCDVIEFTAEPEGIQLPGRPGFWQPTPIEYKRGREKHNPCDEAHLCAQAICLEEMLLAAISHGFIFYGQTRHRVQVDFNEELRTLVHKAANEMHEYFRRGHTPRVRPSKACRSCSLKEICLPDLLGKTLSASHYIQQYLEEA